MWATIPASGFLSFFIDQVDRARVAVESSLAHTLRRLGCRSDNPLEWKPSWDWEREFETRRHGWNRGAPARRHRLTTKSWEMRQRVCVAGEADAPLQAGPP